jgi:hypothetical protein
MRSPDTKRPSSAGGQPKLGQLLACNREEGKIHRLRGPNIGKTEQFPTLGETWRLSRQNNAQPSRHARLQRPSCHDRRLLELTRILARSGGGMLGGASKLDPDQQGNRRHPEIAASPVHGTTLDD